MSADAVAILPGIQWAGSRFAADRRLWKVRRRVRGHAPVRGHSNGGDPLLCGRWMLHRSDRPKSEIQASQGPAWKCGAFVFCGMPIRWRAVRVTCAGSSSSPSVLRLR